ncbi:MAG TPA: hypothetical protein DEA08_17770 [Planctomycetes bacterium]|nr:hypothetical protein [Planctomycetota bacterium]
MDADERSNKILSAIEPILEPGESYVVSADDAGKVSVSLPGEDDSVRSILSTTHPRLYGYLLAANERISSSSGCALVLVYLAASGLISFGLHSRALHGLFPGDAGGQKLLESLRSGWVYAVLTIVILVVWGKHEAWLEERAYSRERNELSDHLNRERLDAYEVLAHMEGDDSIDTLGKHMKLDQRLGALSGA